MIPADYAASVVKVLREHFPDLANPATAAIIATAVQRNGGNPQASFECIIDDPGSARFRLKADSSDRRRVRLAYYPVIPPGSEAGNELERTVNDALRALEGP